MKQIKFMYAVAAIITGFLFTSCGSDEPVANVDPQLTGKSKDYNLDEVNDSGVSGTVTLEEYDNGSTKITVSLNGTTAGNTHPAHIHLNSEGGPIFIALTSIDGASGESITEVDENNDGDPITYAELVALDAYVNIHLSATDLSVIARGGIGAFSGFPAATINYDVTNSGATAYIFNGNGLSSSSNPNLTLKRGGTYTFTINAPGHPFLIKSVQGTGTGNQYSNGVTGNGATSGTVTFVVPNEAPGTLFYNCEFHGAMTGTITITD